jgi:hypothetical protein
MIAILTGVRGNLSVVLICISFRELSFLSELSYCHYGDRCGDQLNIQIGRIKA